jgi:flagellar motor switch protein FliM
MENITDEAGAVPAGEATAASLEIQPPLLQPSPEDREPCATSDSTEMIPVLRGLDSEEDEELPVKLRRLPAHLRQIPFRLELRVPLSRFTLRDLQELAPGTLLITEHLSVRDLVLSAAGERLLLVELESIEQQLGARVKRLAWRHKWRRKA